MGRPDQVWRTPRIGHFVRRKSRRNRIATLKEQGIDVELANWRSVVAAPGITDDQKKELLAAVDAMHASDAWKKVLADKKWIDLYQSGNEFSAFLKSENERVAGVLKTIGLVQ